MTWVKLGEERVNTEHVKWYDRDDDYEKLVIRFEFGEGLRLDDDDGALLRALDEACGLEPRVAECAWIADQGRCIR